MYKKMKLFICFMISIYTLMLSSAFANQVTINTEVLNMRENPSTNSAIIGKVQKNEKFEIIETSNNWIKITKDNKQGWICKDYVVVSENITNNATQNVTASVQVESKQKVVNTSKLNVRDSASTNSNIIGGLYKDTIVEVLDTQNGWDKIKTSSITGWVSNAYLIVNNVASTQTETQKNVTITTNILNVRDSASANSNVIGKLSYNTEVTVLGEENGWYKINYANGYGYISSIYTVLSNSLSSRGNYTRQDVNIAAQLAEKALSYLGYRYVYGGATPSGGFDCSGLVYYVYKNYVTNLPRGATSQSKLGTYVEKQNLQKGDLIYFTENAGTNITHVGIYLENGYFVHAANSRRGVVKDTILSGYYNTNYLFAKRVI